jgi:hypothetical protein
MWIRIQRIGDTFRAFFSTDGTTWTQRGTDQTIAMTSSTQIGLCITSHNAGSTATAVFSNVEIVE